jgi:hypothetical protein
VKWNAPDSISRANKARLIEEAIEARLRVLRIGPSAEREWLIREARYSEAAARGVN